MEGLGEETELEVPLEPELGPALPSAGLAYEAGAPSRAERRRRADRDILRLAWPAVVSQLLATSVSVIDLWMLGRLGTTAVAVAGYTSQYYQLAQAALLGLSVACIALMSRALGAGDPARARRAFAASLGLAVGSAAVISAASLLFPREFLGVLGARPEVAEMAVPYFRFTLGATVFFAASLTVESAFRSARNTAVPLLIASGITVVKLALNALLIFGAWGFPAWGLAGAGAATLGAQVVGIVLFAAVARRRGRPESPAVRLSRADFAGAFGLLAETARISWPAAGERILINAALFIYFRVLSSYGPAAIAAYTVGVRLLAFSWTAPTGISIAASTLVGQALGASDARLAARAGWRAARLSLLASLPLFVVFALLRTTLAESFTHDPEVIPQLESFMILLGAAQPFLSVHFTLSGALRGAGDTTTPLWSAIFGNWIFRVPLALGVVHLHLPVVWVWGTVVFDHVTRAVWLTWSFRRERWARNLGASAQRAA
ncbi:MAG TPA: MATE family efflux transporter [Myxococcota bacterium]|nr:MATE family efflux transporter [Myxococcota bacterium]